MLISAWDSFACHDNVMTSCHDVITWRHGLTATCCKVAHWPTCVVKPWNKFGIRFICWLVPEIVLHVTITSWRHVMTSWHFCNMCVKCSNDLSVWWNPWFTIGLLFLCPIAPVIALHVTMTSWRPVMTSRVDGNSCKVSQWPTCVVKTLK